ncbi:MAG: LamG domain-containing protein [Chromatiales bacterium]|nr:LamG domain-containing protein [Chromatiales bacterium]
MNHQQYYYAVTLLFSILMLLLTSCGGGDGGTSDTEDFTRINASVSYDESTDTYHLEWGKPTFSDDCYTTGRFAGQNNAELYLISHPNTTQRVGVWSGLAHSTVQNYADFSRSDAHGTILEFMDVEDQRFIFWYRGCYSDEIYESTAFDVGIIPLPSEDTSPDNLVPPSNISISSSDQSITINWDSVSGANSYNVYIARESGISPDNYGSLLGGVLYQNTSPPFTVNELSNDTTYYLVVTSTSSGSESNPSNEFSATPINQDAQGGLIAYYAFDRDAADTSGNNNHGIAHNGVTYSAGVTGNAAMLDGINHYIELPRSDDLFASDHPAEISLSFWLQFGDLYSTASVINEYDASFYDDYFPFVIARSQNNELTAVTRYRSGGHVDHSITIDDGSLFRVGEWHHIGYVFSQSTGQIKGYVDGVLIDQTAISQTSDYTDNDPIYIGVTRFQGVMQGYLNGKIDELRIYNRPLSDSEIASLANNLLPSPDLPEEQPATTVDISEVWVVNGRYSNCTNSAQATMSYNIQFGSVMSMVLSGDTWHHDCTITQLSEPITIDLSGLNISNPVTASDYQQIQQTFSDVVSGDVGSHTTNITSFTETSISVQFLDARDSSTEIVNYSRQ